VALGEGVRIGAFLEVVGPGEGAPDPDVAERRLLDRVPALPLTIQTYSSV
jgi:hypothetical protein